MAGALALAALAACAPVGDSGTEIAAAAETGDDASGNDAMDGTPRTLPHSGGKTFETLDAYLEHRKALGAIDIPYYVEVEPGLYRLERGRGFRDAPDETFTRAELLEKYGFSK